LFASSVVYNAERNHTKEDYIDEIVNRGLYSKRKIEKAKEAFLIRESYMRATVAPIGLNYFPILPTINVPVLLIGGARDRVTPILNLCLMAMFIRRVQKVIFPNTGHLSNIERSTLFNRCVSDFIGNI
jgi:pimeloyl-ACP methyl ester carboxylesterase